LGADHCRLGPDQRGLGALASGARAVERFALDRLRVLDWGLVGRWKLEHRSHFVECHLLDVPSFLGAVECLLIDVPGGLLTIDSRLAISKDAFLLRAASAALAPLILGYLFLIDSQLLPITDELLPFTEGLLKISQALFASQLSFAWHVRLPYSFT
jgi:hypothetical protein